MYRWLCMYNIICMHRYSWPVIGSMELILEGIHHAAQVDLFDVEIIRNTVWSCLLIVIDTRSQM